jgi:hypothetical protein
MGVKEVDEDFDNLPQLKKESELSFVSTYLANPAFPFLYNPEGENLAQLHNGGLSLLPGSPPADGSFPLLPPGESPLLGSFLRNYISLALVQNGDVSAISAIEHQKAQNQVLFVNHWQIKAAPCFFLSRQSHQSHQYLWSLKTAHMQDQHQHFSHFSLLEHFHLICKS